MISILDEYFIVGNAESTSARRGPLRRATAAERMTTENLLWVGTIFLSSSTTNSCIHLHDKIISDPELPEVPSDNSGSTWDIQLELANSPSAAEYDYATHTPWTRWEWRWVRSPISPTPRNTTGTP